MVYKVTLMPSFLLTSTFHQSGAVLDGAVGLISLSKPRLQWPWSHAVKCWYIAKICLESDLMDGCCPPEVRSDLIGLCWWLVYSTISGHERQNPGSCYKDTNILLVCSPLYPTQPPTTPQPILIRYRPLRCQPNSVHVVQYL